MISLMLMLTVSGCTTMKDTYVRSKNEVVRIEYSNDATNKVAFVVPDWATGAAKQIGSWALKEVSKKYTATWEDNKVIPMVNITNGTMRTTLVTIKRIIDNETVESVSFKFVPIDGLSDKKYFSIEEDQVVIGKTKAKMTKFLSWIVPVDEVAMNVTLEMNTPNAVIQGGINTYTWNLVYAGVVPHWTNTTHRMSIWEVPSKETHMGIHITIVEENKLAGWLLQGSDALK